MENVLRSIYKKIRQNNPWGEKFTQDLSPSVISKIVDSGLEPRLVQKELIAACGKAVLRQSGGSAFADGGYEVNADDFNPRRSVKSKGKIIIMPIFSVASVNEEPEETMMRWSIREVLFDDSTDKSRHLVGYILRKGKGRVSSAIQSFDRDKMRIKTASGRLYQLEGQSGFDPDAEYVWAQWKKLNAVLEESDVTHEYRLMH